MFYVTNLTEGFHNDLLELWCALHALLLHAQQKLGVPLQIGRCQGY